MTTNSKFHRSSRGLRRARLLVIGALLVMFLAGPALPMTTGTGISEASSHIPPGQLTRKSLSGTVTAVSSSSISVGTKFGTVEVLVNSETVVDAPPEKNVGIGAVTVGSKVVVQLNRSPLEKVEPDPEEGGDTGDTTNGTTTDSGTGGTTNGTTTDSGTGGTTNGTTTDSGTGGTTNGTTTDSGTGGTTNTTTTDSGTGGSTDTGGSATTTDDGTGGSATTTAFALPDESSEQGVDVAVAIASALDIGGLQAGTIVIGSLGISGLSVSGLV
jgi:hypothetical protein